MPGVEIKLAGTPPADDLPVVPTLGADTRAVLHKLGMSTDDVDQLRDKGVIVC